MIDLSASLDPARRLRALLDKHALEALQAGMDWAEGPPDHTLADMAYAPDYYEVRAGAVQQGSIMPAGWRVIRHDDWVAAGRPGL